MKSLRRGISISIVTYNTWDRTVACVETLLEKYDNDEFEILIHDNGSESAPLETWPEVVRIVTSEQNLGFGTGHNANLGRASFDTFVILNPDVSLRHETLDALSDAVQLSGVAAAAPILLFPDGSEQLSFRRFPSLMTECARIIGADRKPDSRWSTLIRVQPAQGHVQVQQPAAAVLAVKTETMHAISGFDTNFPMYFEDVDLCARLNKEGKILAITDYTAFHDGEGTAKSYRTMTTFWIENSRRRYHRKFETGPRLQLLLCAIWFSGMTHLLGTAIFAIVATGEKREMLLAKSHGYGAALMATVIGSDKYWREKFLRS